VDIVFDRVPGVSDVEPVGTSDTGEVLRGIDTDTGNPVTVKVLAGKVSDEQFDRFTSTCRSVRSLASNPNIARLYDAGTTSDGFPYLVVERRTRTLADLVAQQGRLRWQEAVALGSEIAAGLDAAHRMNVVHGDLSPDTVLLTDDDEPRLTDFGVRALLTAPDTTGATGGKSAVARLAHSAPEVVQGRRGDERSDIYSLASTLFAAIAGNPAFVRASDENVVPMVSRVLGEEPPSLASLGVPAAVESAIVGAMAKDPAMRPSTAELFRQELLAAARAASGTEATAAGATAAATGAEAALGRRSDRTRAADSAKRPPRRRTIDMVIGAVALVAVIAIIWVASSGGNDDSSADTPTTDALVSSTAATSAPTSAAPSTTAAPTTAAPTTAAPTTAAASTDSSTPADSTPTSEVSTTLPSNAITLTGTGFHITSFDNPKGGLTITYPADHQGHFFDIAIQYTGNKNPLLCPARTRPKVESGSTFSSLSFGGCLQDGQGDMKLRVKSWGKGTVKVSLYLCDVTRTVNWCEGSTRSTNTVDLTLIAT